MAAKMTSYGLSHEQVADILGRDIRTIEPDSLTKLKQIECI
jgi:hypothetical protein